MEITPKAMEIAYIRVKRFDLKKEKAYAIGWGIIRDRHYRRIRMPVSSWIRISYFNRDNASLIRHMAFTIFSSEVA